jgi:peptide/nickel transport system substrate-binding protein
MHTLIGRRSFRAIATLSFAAIVACTRVDTSTVPGASNVASTAAQRHAWTVPNTLRVASGNVPRTLNPILSTQTVESALTRLVSDILVTVDAHGTLVPDIAREVPTIANGGISADGLTITYHLRPHVRWTDGVPFTSRDVKFTFDAIMNRDNDVISRHGYDDVRSVETPDPLTVVFHLKRRFAPFVATVFGDSDSPYGILPAHLLATYPNLNNVPYNAAPIGTGPYKFVRWLRGDRIEFVRNDDFFGGKPKIERIIWRLIPDENTEITLLRTHEIDWIFEAEVTSYKVLTSLPETNVVLQPVNGYVGVMMNTQAGHPTADRAVRRAIAMAIDKQRLVTDLTDGAGVVATGDLPPFMWAFDPRVKSLPHDPAAARATITKTGSTPAKPLALDLVYEESTIMNRALVVQLQSELAPIGIDLHPRAQLSSTIYGGYGAGGTLARGRYDIAVYPWTAGIDPDDSAQFVCANRPPNGYNESFYCSPAMDAAQARALDSYDQATRKPAYATVQSLLVRDAPVVFLWWLRYVQPINPDLHGFDPNPVVETWDIAHWSL